MIFSKNWTIWPICILFSVIWKVQTADHPLCGDWLPFKDEKCFKILDDTPRTYDEAEKACNILASAPILPVIHTQDEQDFLANYLFKQAKNLNNFWLGAKSSSTNVFHWIDESALTYTNWAGKSSKGKPNYCIQMQSEEGETTLGKWIDEPCEKKVSVVCQKMQFWTLPQLQKAFMEARKQLAEQKLQLDEANRKLNDPKHLDLFPVGFVYTQMPKEKTPKEIWPWMVWDDVSASYAGVFFRVQGNGSEVFGGPVQEGHAPRLVRIDRNFNNSLDHVESFLLDADSTSKRIYTGDYVLDGSGAYNHSIDLSFVISGGEVRPRNVAIRLWKRTG